MDSNLSKNMTDGDQEAPPTPWYAAQHAMQHERPTFQGLVGHFAGHVVLGALGFICVAIPAILFSILAHYLHQIPVSDIVISVLVDIHYLLLGVDTVVFVAYILVSLYVTAVELIRYVRGI